MRALKYLGIILGAFVFVLMIAVAFIFTKPGVLLTEKNIRLALDKSGFLTEYSFKSLIIDHTYEKWNQRVLRIKTTDFCFNKTDLAYKAQGCLENLSLDLRIIFSPGLEVQYLTELDANFSQINLEMLNPESEEAKVASEAPQLDLKSTLSLIENKWIPDLSLKVDIFQFIRGDQLLETPILFSKRDGVVSGELFDFHLIIHPGLVSLQGPEAFLIPFQDASSPPLTIDQFSLVLRLLENDWDLSFSTSIKQINFGLSGLIPNELNFKENELFKNFENLKLSIRGEDLSDFSEVITFLDKKSLSRMKFNSLFTYQSTGSGGDLVGLLDFSFQNNSLSFHSKTSVPALNELVNNWIQAQESLLSSTVIEFDLDRKKDEWSQLNNLDIIPAPLNAMDGKINVRIWGERQANKVGGVYLKADAFIDFSSENQDFKFKVGASIPYNFKTKELGVIGTRLEVGKIRLSLPRVSTTSLPPQVLPDQRFKLNQGQKKEVVSDAPKLNFEFITNESKPLEIASNLLDEPLRLVVNLSIVQSVLEQGTIQLLPLNTTFFRRPILVKDMILKLEKNQEPYLSGVVEFLLPEYKVSLNLVGPIQSVRSYFTSEPPLQIDDIYAVLLFGRPMTDLDAQAKSDAQRSAQVLSQSILSLTTLYFFAGSPVESLGYDPDRSEVSAQFGLSRNSSLRVSSQAQGERSAGVRRNLGRGWYLDTSVQQNSSQGTSGQAVLLERIIAY